MKTCHVQCTTWQSCSKVVKNRKLWSVPGNAFTALDGWRLLLYTFTLLQPLLSNLSFPPIHLHQTFIILSCSQTRIQSVPVPQGYYAIQKTEGGGKLTKKNMSIVSHHHCYGPYKFCTNFSQKMGKACLTTYCCSILFPAEIFYNEL